MSHSRVTVPVHTTPLVPERPDELRAFVTVTRTSPEDWGMRQVIVRLDAGPRLMLLFGQSVTLEVLPGRHQLRSHNTIMWRTIDFAVEPGEHLEFVIINRRGPILTALLSFFPSPTILTVKKRSLR